MKGDLSLAHFGWNDEEYEKRGKEIDVVYHNGATVNAMLPYSLLRSQNVTSAIELLSFATTFKYTLIIILIIMPLLIIIIID